MPCGGLWENVLEFINCGRVYAFGRRGREGLMGNFGHLEAFSSSSIAEPFGERRELQLRIQIFEPLRRRDVAFEPVLAVLTMKTDIRLLPGGFDEPDGTIESSTGASTEV